MIGMASRRAQLKPVYSLSVFGNEIYVCSWDLQRIEHPTYKMQYPCLDLAVSRYIYYFSSQLPAKYASTYTSTPLYFTGSSIVTLYLATFRYLARHRIDSACSLLGHVENFSHWWVMYSMSEHETFYIQFIFPMTDQQLKELSKYFGFQCLDNILDEASGVGFGVVASNILSPSNI